MAMGERLRDLRERAGISSQEALAHKAGVHRTYIGRLERGESGVTVEALAAILAALGVSLREFFRPFKELVKPRTPRRRGRSA
jgi:transcriptional regulator with XRE-family HTH domain